MMKRRYMIPLLILVVLGIAYWAGPRLPRTELNTDLPDLPVGIDRISEYVQDREARLPVKPDNQGINQLSNQETGKHPVDKPEFRHRGIGRLKRKQRIDDPLRLGKQDILDIQEIDHDNDPD